MENCGMITFTVIGPAADISVGPEHVNEELVLARNM